MYWSLGVVRTRMTKLKTRLYCIFAKVHMNYMHWYIKYVPNYKHIKLHSIYAKTPISRLLYAIF